MPSNLMVPSSSLPSVNSPSVMVPKEGVPAFAASRVPYTFQVVPFNASPAEFALFHWMAGQLAIIWPFHGRLWRSWSMLSTEAVLPSQPASFFSYLIAVGLYIMKSWPTYTRPLVLTCDSKLPFGTRMLPSIVAAGSSVVFLDRWLPSFSLLLSLATPPRMVTFLASLKFHIIF